LGRYGRRRNRPPPGSPPSPMPSPTKHRPRPFLGPYTAKKRVSPHFWRLSQASNRVCARICSENKWNMGCTYFFTFCTRKHMCDVFVIRVIGRVSIGELRNMHGAVRNEYQGVYLYGGCEVWEKHGNFQQPSECARIHASGPCQVDAPWSDHKAS
jgi:hypothetical protein